MKKRNYIILAVILVGGAFLVNSLLTNRLKDKKDPIAEEKGFVTELYKIERQTMVESLGYNGTLWSSNSASLSSLVQGQVMEVLVNEGDSVQKGDLLIQVDVDKLLAKKASVIKTKEKVSSQLAYANKKKNDYYSQNSLLSKLETLDENIRYQQEELAKLNQLLEAGAIASSMVEGVEHQLELLKIQKNEVSATIDEGYDQLSNEVTVLSKQIEEIDGSLKEINLSIGDGNIRAPIDGKVTSLLVSKGELLSPGKPVLNIEEITNLVARASVGEVGLVKLKEGMKAYLSIGSGEKTYDGYVKYLSPSINSNTRLGDLEVSVEIPVDEIVFGASAQIKVILSEEKDQILIPSSAIKSFNSNDIVYVQADDKKVYERQIQLGKKLGDSYQVLQGLEEGETIAITNVSSLGNGVAIYTISKEKD